MLIYLITFLLVEIFAINISTKNNSATTKKLPLQPIIIILLLFLLGIGGYFIYDMVFVNFNNNDTFSMDTNSGRVIVTGYVTSEIIQENLYEQ